MCFLRLPPRILAAQQYFAMYSLAPISCIMDDQYHNCFGNNMIDKGLRYHAIEQA